MKTLNLTKKDWYRFESLCKLYGLTVQTDANYTYNNLCETENCYLRIIKNNQTVCLAYLIK
jgi:hypothetical protein